MVLMGAKGSGNRRKNTILNVRMSSLSFVGTGGSEKKKEKKKGRKNSFKI